MLTSGHTAECNLPLIVRDGHLRSETNKRVRYAATGAGVDDASEHPAWRTQTRNREAQRNPVLEIRNALIRRQHTPTEQTRAQRDRVAVRQQMCDLTVNLRIPSGCRTLHA